MASRWVLLTIMAVHLVQCNERNTIDDIIPLAYEPSWTYKCDVTKGCERSEHPHPTGIANVTGSSYSSLDVCRTVCGRFGGLWPKPVTVSLSQQTVPIHPNNLRFDLIDVPVEARSFLVEMTKLVGPNLLAECGGNVTVPSEKTVVVFLTVANPDLTLTFNTDESYSLDVQNKDQRVLVHINAQTVYGARHALETFTQLVAADRPDFSDQKQCGLLVLAGAKIKDKPAFKYRGLVLDTSRHFIPMADIKRTIDGMAANKMNAFHWHVTDSHSFPLESARVPQFTKYGAYSQEEIYTTEEVRDLIRYASVRGVRIVIEIDAPAHAGNGWQWGKEYGLGDLAVCVNAQTWRKYCIQPPCGQLNPANPAMYRVLKELYKDIYDLVPKPVLLHMGGDEVFLECWASSEEIRTYMTNQGYNLTQDGYMKLWTEFHAKTLQAWDEVSNASGVNAEPVLLWSSDLTQAAGIKTRLDPSRYVIVVWEPINSYLLVELLHLGYRTISVPKDIWYLDHGFWGTTKYSNWRRMYSYKLPTNPGSLGGSVAMWSEYVDTNALDGRIWPRTAAVAERLWSNPESDFYSAETRMQRQRSRLIARGLKPDAISPAWCSQHDSSCL